MNDKSASEPLKRKMTRCPEGHIFDASAHEACPTCGARAPEAAAAKKDEDGDAPAPRPDPTPRPAWLRPALIGGAGLIGVLIIALALRGAPGGVATDKPAVVVDKAVEKTRDERPTGGLAVERWQTVMMIGGRKYVCVNETQSDGRYRLGDGCPAPFAGETGVTTVNPDGSWVTRSDRGRVDSGTLEVVSEDKVIAHTRGGPVLWERVKP